MSTNENAGSGEGMKVVKLMVPYLGKHGALLTVGIIGTVLGALVSFSIGVAIKHVVDSVPTDAEEGYAFLNKVLLVALAVYLLSTLNEFITGYSLVKVATRVVRDLRRDVFSSLLGKKVSYLEKHPSGELQTRMISDTGVVGDFATQQVPKIVTAAISVIAGTVGALLISVRFTLIVLAMLPFVFLPILVWGRKLRDLGALIQEKTAEFGKATGEVFRNIKVVHAYTKEDQENARVSELADAVATTSVRSSLLQIALSASMYLMATTAVNILLWTAARGIYSGAWTVGGLMSFAYFNGLIVTSAGGFFGFVASLKQTTGAAVRIMEYLSVEDRASPKAASAQAIRGTVEFQDVHFRYPSRPETDVLKGASFKIEAGVNTVIVGPSGAGKSALFELLLGLYTPDTGCILVDNRDLRETSRDQLRSSIGYVPQKESLLSGSVFDNIVYGSSTADEAKVMEAAQVACAHDFILQLPQGYQTDLGEVAARLSGGQRQRISLARALVREPRILLLDEDKSALDAESERRVSASVRNWAAAHGATVISIAHRLSSISRADRILVMDGGVIAGYGSHADLLKNCDTYRNLVSSYSRDSEVATFIEHVPGVAISAA